MIIGKPLPGNKTLIVVRYLTVDKKEFQMAMNRADFSNMFCFLYLSLMHTEIKLNNTLNVE